MPPNPFIPGRPIPTPMKERFTLYLLGTAGSGKTTLARAFKRWLDQEGLDSVLVNLDPGVAHLPYEADVDVREWIRLDEVMDTYDLGPNGAQVAAADMLAMNAGVVQEALAGFETDFFICDTPGQVELFVFREAGRVLVEQLGTDRSLLAFLIDPFLAKDASGFVTQLLVSATAQFRFHVPAVHLLGKADLLEPGDRERFESWTKDPEGLLDEIVAEEPSMYREVAVHIHRMLEDLGGWGRLHPVSSTSGEGMEDLYNAVVEAYKGGEDVRPD